jgi:transcriptional regulator with XRE-family HTH domain
MVREFTPLARWLLRQLGERRESARAASIEAGMDHAAISRFLRGTQPSPESCQKIAAYFGVPVEEVLSLAGHMPTPPGHDAFLRHVAEIAQDYSVDQRKQALEHLRAIQRLGRES